MYIYTCICICMISTLGRVWYTILCKVRYNDHAQETRFNGGFSATIPHKSICRDIKRQQKESTASLMIYFRIFLFLDDMLKYGQNLQFSWWYTEECFLVLTILYHRDSEMSPLLETRVIPSTIVCVIQKMGLNHYQFWRLVQGTKLTALTLQNHIKGNELLP